MIAEYINRNFNSRSFLIKLLDSMGVAMLILKKDLRIQAFNSCSKTLFFDDRDFMVFNNKLGNVLGCSYTIEESKDCGTTSNCKYCTLRSSIDSVFINGQSLSKKNLKKNFYANKKEKRISYIQLSTKLIQFAGKDLALVAIEDITTLERQRIELKEFKLKIEESIAYAERIQQAIMPAKFGLNSHLLNHFILFKPKDKIGGDFYWYAWDSQNLFVAVGDCTGHGVPGSLLSILSITLLNEIALRLEHYSTPSKILNQLGNNIISYLQDKGVNDSLDISLCKINFKSKQITYSGTFNPIYLVRSNDLIEIPANKISIGSQIDSLRFSDADMKLMNKDKIYLFSDGFSDQFGGDKNRKFSKKRLKEKLQSIASMNMYEQELALQQTFANWKGSNPQIDDVCILGIEIA